MSTRGNICVKVAEKDFNRVNKIISCGGKAVSTTYPYLYIYNHFDSYPDGLGRDLNTDYTTYEKALELVLQGDCSCPGMPYTGRGESFEDNCPKVTGDKLSALEQEYLYVFEDNSWKMFH